MKLFIKFIQFMPFFTLMLKLETVNAANMSVQPLFFDIQPNSDQQEYPFEITITADAALTAKVSVYKAIQNEGGYLDFKELTNSNFEALLELKENKHKFLRAGKWVLSGLVKFPRNQNKTLAYALMVEEEKPVAQTGIGISVRYAVVLKVKTSQKRLIESGIMQIAQPELKKEKLLFKSMFENNSDLDYTVEAFASIRNDENKLIENISLRTLSSWQKNESISIVFPQAKVQLVGELTKIPKPGKYKATIYAKINGKKQLIKSDDVVITQEHLKIRKYYSENVSIDPLPMNIIYKPDQTSMYRIQFNNPHNEEVSVEIKDNSNENNLYSFFPSEMKVLPKSKKTSVFKVKNNKGLNWKIDSLSALIKNSQGKLLQTIPLPVSFIEDNKKSK